MTNKYEEVAVRSRRELRRWLEKNHSTSPGIWLVTYGKRQGQHHVPYDDVVEEALCYGWIDSQAKKLDEERSALRLTPRKPSSGWSPSNKERVARLTEEGRMTPAGLAVVEAAKASGAWTALDQANQLLEPDDLLEALAANPQAEAKWRGFTPSARKALLAWITTARRPETRARRIAQTVEEAAAGRRADEPRPK
ncbi:MAG TPA: YdeI/OmpD-associated family protein [Acidimicrobiia bacterium]|nr:YdeI/OmpD-associated family protein [Acidimicrobiia bacterium]